VAPEHSPEHSLEHSNDGVDLTLIRWMLSLTPRERLNVLQNFVHEINEIRHVIANQQNPG
jgi:hypothetical protein